MFPSTSYLDLQSIHTEIMDRVQEALDEALINNIPNTSPIKGGVVKQGSLQGDPDPDVARISVTVHENDPDRFFGSDNTSAFGSSEWEDEVDHVEIGGAITMKRRFTVKSRCLLVNSYESAADAQRVARSVRSRIEATILGIDWTSIQTEEEYVSRGAFAETLKSEMVQAGGPPDAFDFYIKVRFEVLTTRSISL